MGKPGPRTIRSIALISLLALVAPLDAAADLPATIDLATAAVARIDGSAAGAGFGDGALAVGDVDGDGAPDLVVGAPDASATRGELYCFLGRAGALPSSRDLSVASADVTIVGPEAGVRLGVAASVVDLDADGAGELVVAAAGYAPAYGRLASGGALLFRGGPSLRTRVRIDLATERADSSIVGARYSGSVGASLARADFDDDGFADLALAAPAADGFGGASRAGRVAIFFGGESLPDAVVEVEASPRVAFVGGAAANDGNNMTVASGDVTGDGVDDLLVGTPIRTVIRAVPIVKGGEVFVVGGHESLRPGALVDLADGGMTARVLGSDNGDYFGRAVAAADVTGDRIADVVASAIDGDGIGNSRDPDCGEVSVVTSEELATAGGVVDLYRKTPWLWVIGEAERRFVGTALDAGDLDGDRLAETVVASRNAPHLSGSGAGAIYVVAPAPGTIDLANTAPATTIYGPSTNAALGSALLLADLDGDGAKEIVAGSPGALNGRGSVYLISSGRSRPNAPPAIDAPAPVSSAPGVEVTVELRATDADGDPVKLGILNRPPGARFEDRHDGTATLRYTRVEGDTESYIATVTASDGAATSHVDLAFSLASGDAPTIASVKYRNGKLKIRGERFASGAEVFVNGTPAAVAPIVKPARGRILLRATREALGLSSEEASNRLYVVVDGLASPEYLF
jgi:hypothetical protein